jgi:hypothetical protein
MKFSKLLRLLGSTPFPVEFKGGYRELGSKNIVITTNRPPNKMYNLPDEDIKQLIRRTDHLIDFDDPIQLAHAEHARTYFVRREVT